MTEVQALLAGKEAEIEDAGANAALKAKILGQKPNWASVDSRNGWILDKLHGVDSGGMKDAFGQNAQMLQACMDVLGSSATRSRSDPQPTQYVLMSIFEGLRSDGALHDVLVRQASQGTDVFGPLTKGCLQDGAGDKYVKDTAAYVLTAIMSHAGGNAFGMPQVEEVLGGLVTGSYMCSEKGRMDALANLVKCDPFRPIVWAKSSSLIVKGMGSTTSAVIYKAAFAVWMLAGSKDMLTELEKVGELGKAFQNLFAFCRVEKVIRIGLAGCKNLLNSNSCADALVEAGCLEAVQSLEYEKWRDAELYDDVRDLANVIGTRVSQLSSFDRYEKELATGKLTWGFIHSEKFWNQNVMKFEKDEFKAVKSLGALLTQFGDPTTLSVACHDIGEFVRLHPIGKKIVSKLGIKGGVMSLMSNGDREVAREALLCTQKIMLNKWQELGEE